MEHACTDKTILGVCLAHLNWTQDGEWAVGGYSLPSHQSLTPNPRRKLVQRQQKRVENFVPRRRGLALSARRRRISASGLADASGREQLLQLPRARLGHHIVAAANKLTPPPTSSSRYAPPHATHQPLSLRASWRGTHALVRPGAAEQAGLECVPMKSRHVRVRVGFGRGGEARQGGDARWLAGCY